MEENHHITDQNGDKTISLTGMYQNYFLDYASYVILERAVPAIEDGLKPVQRRILHSMFELEDGRYNKVANVIGNTMKYHPHGDASINDAMVQIGQKELLIDTQGNWGNIYTGDSAAASRYIEARLTKFALDVVFNAKTTNWQMSYDGRNKEPVTLPVKFPLLLAQGVEGIAVGLACKIMPHNFVELIDASIDILKGKKVQIFPDFPTAGMIDISKYNNGLRGGKIRVRAKMNIVDSKTLCVTEIPFGTTTSSLIDSVISASDKGKIKIKKIEDNTAENVEILIHLPPGISPDQTIDALYAFTDCEISISPNSCVIVDQKPIFMGVDQMLAIAAKNTVDLLKKELEIKKSELQESILFTSLEKIFIEKRIYRDIEECETWEEIIETIDKGLKPYKKKFYREIVREDIEKLTEIKIKRISKFDSFKADEQLKGLNNELESVQSNLDNIVSYAIDYFKELKKKYGKGRERKAEIRSFESIEATQVVIRNEKLYVDYENGFAGYGLKNAEFVADCSDIDDIIVFREDGTMTVSKVTDKAYIGKGILHIAVWKKDDERTIYHMVYRDGPLGATHIKRFSVTSIIRDKDYDLTKGTKGSKVVYFSVNPNGESEVLSIYLKPRPKLKKQVFDFDLADLAIKGRNSQGNVLSKFPIRKIVSKAKGESTLGGLKFWFDPYVRRLNNDEKGQFLGEFTGNDRLLIITQTGMYRLIKPDLSLHFDDDVMTIEKFNKKKCITTIYFDGEKKEYIAKRFHPETMDKNVLFITDHLNSKVHLVSTDSYPMLMITAKRNQSLEKDVLNVHEQVGVINEKSKGKKLNYRDIKLLSWMDPLPEPSYMTEKQEDEPETGDIVKEIDLEADDEQQKLF
jgi:topoisomerase-4 subunit A